ncbi:MAG: discoidin domain-containing protein [Armatimonadota bacterium]
MRPSRNMILLHSCVLGALGAGFLTAGARVPPAGVDVGEQMRALIEADWIERDRRFAGPSAAGEASAQRNARGVTTAQDAAGGCDGVKNGRWGFHTASKERDPWWQVDLGEELALDRVVVFNRTDGGTAPRTRSIRVLVSREADPEQFTEVYQHNGETFYGVKEEKPLVVDLRGKHVSARIVRLHVPGQCSFALDEVEVYPADEPQTNVALGKPADQKSVGPHSYPGTMGELSPASIAGQGGGLSLAHTRDVVSRGQGLIARLRPTASSHRLGPLAAELRSLDRRLAQLERADDVLEDGRRAIYLEARWLVRKIAFCNPLLDFDRLLFIKRHDPGGVFHMCDQYYGFNAKPGGGLFVLSDPFSPTPRLTNLLEHSVVQDGRLGGSKLAPGSFLSPEVSWDGETVLFAYTQCQGSNLTWTPEASYHIFRANADGTGLVQLTDGSWNDFDPCFLPSGRVAFISERRGGYLRCGRHCPVYTMYWMEPDGSDIRCFSFHETHEWHPSVDNDGMVVYTRWDYVDRDTNIAHHMWRCFPDGRNPRSFHGNYPQRRESRPWMEMSIRAIPGSPKYVATAASHHGNAFGSLVLIDPRVEDDGASAQLERLTPDALFPEAEGRTPSIRDHMVYGTPWPLSEDDYLCVYDANARNRGIYWIDRFGNKELIYRDPSISCLSPIPLRPRKRPPIIPDRTMQTAVAEKAAERRPATIAVMNVYDSDFEWPEGTVVDALRIVQALPKTTPPPNKPRIGVADQTNARAVLGTVPVEADGSAYFQAPVGRAIYFQALDEQGMAVQSMRSVTYVHAGEQLTCRGCHEPRLRASQPVTTTAMALRRAPSPIRPEVDGANPFNYPRLVQPVLDRNCVSCHREKQVLDLSGAMDGKSGFTRSYNNLAGKYGFYFHVRNGSINTGVHGGSRTTPGKFGARAAPLLEYLDQRHYGVKLSQDDFHRLVLWLDCNSEFYGAYENTEAQARGEVVWPSLN